MTTRRCSWCARDFPDYDTIVALLQFNNGGILTCDHKDVYCYECFIKLSNEEVKEMPPR